MRWLWGRGACGGQLGEQRPGEAEVAQVLKVDEMVVVAIGMGTEKMWLGLWKGCMAGLPVWEALHNGAICYTFGDIRVVVQTAIQYSDTGVENITSVSSLLQVHTLYCIYSGVL